MKKITVPIAVLALALPAVASGHDHYRAHLSMVQAKSAIVRWVGPGTVTTKCRQFAPSVVGCDYETPSINVGIWFEDEATGFKPESGTWHGYVTVSRQNGKLTFSEPE